MHVLDILKDRGYIAQITHEDEIRQLLDQGSVTFYTGFDPTAESLHIGHMIPLMVMAHLQRSGHRPIVILGGGTGMIGDPSGRTDMRRFLDRKSIQHNVDRFREQASILIDFSDDKALMMDNAEWILPLNYVDFIRDIGAHFSVNRMLAAECYKNRLEAGLTFLEFNYMLLQANDFLYLHDHYNCQLQMGGDDQWSNILAGMDLIRRKRSHEAYGFTLNLLTNSNGVKMGKTQKGALWLDEAKCSVYDFYQYFRNVEDPDVTKCMKLLTFMSMEVIAPYEKMEGAELNEAKKRLAYEVTAVVHGKEKAREAATRAEAVYGAKTASADDMPGSEISGDDIGRPLLDLLLEAGLIKSKGEGRRLMEQGGLRLNDEPVTDYARALQSSDLKDGSAVIRKGKKVYHALRMTKA